MRSSDASGRGANTPFYSAALRGPAGTTPRLHDILPAVERLLARLERRFGKYAPGNLTYMLIAAQLAGLVLGMAAPEKQSYLHFELDRILQGEVWRVITWVAIPPWVTPGPGAGFNLIGALFTL